MPINDLRLELSNPGILEVSCYNGALDVHVYWNQPMRNMYPEASVPTATRVTAYIGDMQPWQMAWTHERGGRISGVPRTQLSISSGIDSAIFGLLGMDNLAERNSEMFEWNAATFVGRLARESSELPGGAVRLSAKDSVGRSINASFRLAGLADMVRQEFRSCA